MKKKIIIIITNEHFKTNPEKNRNKLSKETHPKLGSMMKYQEPFNKIRTS